MAGTFAVMTRLQLPSSCIEMTSKGNKVLHCSLTASLMQQFRRSGRLSCCYFRGGLAAVASLVSFCGGKGHQSETNHEVTNHASVLFFCDDQTSTSTVWPISVVT